MTKRNANELFENGFNCSQSILVAHCSHFGLNRETASKLSVAFGGGIGRQGKICGCASGALMVLGLKYGEGSTTDIKQRIASYEIAKEFCKKFIELNGALNCKDIIKYNLNNPEDRIKAQDNNVFKTRCARVIAITEEILNEYL